MMKVLFVEPPKDMWFVMGEYLPPPFGILQLAAYLEKKDKNVEIEVLDCQAMGLSWKGLESALNLTSRISWLQAGSPPAMHTR